MVTSVIFPIVYIKTESGTSCDDEWQRVTMTDSEWYNEWQMVQWVTKNDNKWQRMTISNSEWQRVVQRRKTNEST